jgi:hypothetical protein
MTVKLIKPRLWPVSIVCLLLAGCGGSSSSSSSIANRAAATSTTAPQGETGAPEGGTAVPSEAQSAATGDIPDNQIFLTFQNGAAGYSIRYPEGWTRSGANGNVTFDDRANVIHVVVAKGPSPLPATASAALAELKRSDPTVRIGRPQQVTIAGRPVLKVTYTRLSAADPVTAKRLPLTIDRYVYAHAGKVAIVDLGTPKGVDNVDAYRMISRSFQWR